MKKTVSCCNCSSANITNHKLDLTKLLNLCSKLTSNPFVVWLADRDAESAKKPPDFHGWGFTLSAKSPSGLLGPVSELN